MSHEEKMVRCESLYISIVLLLRFLPGLIYHWEISEHA